MCEDAKCSPDQPKTEKLEMVKEICGKAFDELEKLNVPFIILVNIEGGVLENTHGENYQIALALDTFLHKNKRIMTLMELIILERTLRDASGVFSEDCPCPSCTARRAERNAKASGVMSPEVGNG